MGTACCGEKITSPTLGSRKRSGGGENGASKDPKSKKSGKKITKYAEEKSNEGNESTDHDQPPVHNAFALNNNSNGNDINNRSVGRGELTAPSASLSSGTLSQRAVAGATAIEGQEGQNNDRNNNNENGGSLHQKENNKMALSASGGSLQRALGGASSGGAFTPVNATATNAPSAFSGAAGDVSLFPAGGASAGSACDSFQSVGHDIAQLGLGGLRSKTKVAHPSEAMSVATLLQMGAGSDHESEELHPSASAAASLPYRSKGKSSGIIGGGTATSPQTVVGGGFEAARAFFSPPGDDGNENENDFDDSAQHHVITSSLSLFPGDGCHHGVSSKGKEEVNRGAGEEKPLNNNNKNNNTAVVMKIDATTTRNTVAKLAEQIGFDGFDLGGGDADAPSPNTNDRCAYEIDLFNEGFDTDAPLPAVASAPPPPPPAQASSSPSAGGGVKLFQFGNMNAIDDNDEDEDDSDDERDAILRRQRLGLGPTTQQSPEGEEQQEHRRKTKSVGDTIRTKGGDEDGAEKQTDIEGQAQQDANIKAQKPNEEEEKDREEKEKDTIEEQKGFSLFHGAKSAPSNAHSHHLRPTDRSHKPTATKKTHRDLSLPPPPPDSPPLFAASSIPTTLPMLFMSSPFGGAAATATTTAAGGIPFLAPISTKAHDSEDEVVAAESTTLPNPQHLLAQTGDGAKAGEEEEKEKQEEKKLYNLADFENHTNEASQNRPNSVVLAGGVGSAAAGGSVVPNTNNSAAAAAAAINELDDFPNNDPKGHHQHYNQSATNSLEESSSSAVTGGVKVRSAMLPLPVLPMQLMMSKGHLSYSPKKAATTGGGGAVVNTMLPVTTAATAVVPLPKSQKVRLADLDSGGMEMPIFRKGDEEKVLSKEWFRSQGVDPPRVWWSQTKTTVTIEIEPANENAGWILDDRNNSVIEYNCDFSEHCKIRALLPLFEPVHSAAFELRTVGADKGVGNAVTQLLITIAKTPSNINLTTKGKVATARDSEDDSSDDDGGSKAQDLERLYKRYPPRFWTQLFSCQRRTYLGLDWVVSSDAQKAAYEGTGPAAYQYQGLARPGAEEEYTMMAGYQGEGIGGGGDFSDDDG